MIRGHFKFPIYIDYNTSLATILMPRQLHNRSLRHIFGITATSVRPYSHAE